MKPRYIIFMALALIVALFAQRIALADKVTLNNGQSIEGIVKKIEKGRVTVEVGGETKVFDVLEIGNIEFDFPRLTAGTPRLPLEHFLANIEAQEMIGHFQEVEDAAAEVRKLVDQTKTEWADRKSIEFNDTAKWATAKERFSAPMAHYQEALNDLYFHVLGKVDQYNSLMKEADSIYVGVKGWLSVGSSLVPSDVKKLPLKKYVPGNWYDTIFFEGYDRGYSDAVEKYRSDPYHPME